MLDSRLDIVIDTAFLMTLLLDSRVVACEDGVYGRSPIP